MTVSEWRRAMLAEAGEPRTVAERVSWRFGVFTTTCRLLVLPAIRGTTTVYFACLSVFVAARLTVELATDRVPPMWGHAWISVVRCLFLVVGSFVVTVALWHRRRIGQPLALAFVAAQLITALVP